LPTKLHYPNPNSGSRQFSPILEGRDLIGLASTGTGKNAAFYSLIQRGLHHKELSEPYHCAHKRAGFAD